MGVLSIFDREDLKAVYELVMEEYQDEIPEGFDKMLWGLMIMFNQGMQAHDATDNELPIPPLAPIAPPTILPPSLVLSLSPMFDFRHFFFPENISPPRDTETPVAGNASNKRKREGNHNGGSSQQNKEHKVLRAQTTKPGNKKVYAGTLPLCNKCKFHHNGQCTVKSANCKRVGHLTLDYRSPATTNNQRIITCYKCRNQGHYNKDCPELKNRNHGNLAGDTEARGLMYALGGGEIDQDPNNMEVDINALTYKARGLSNSQGNATYCAIDFEMKEETLTTVKIISALTVTMLVLRQHHSRHFMVESADHLFTRPKLEMSN
ncbi:hypothetical protein Tco_1252198 [Tanacetum coccineum]